MKRKNGFTLIELLAVIVILAIIALVAVPIILNVIEKSKESSAVDSAYGYIHALEEGIVEAEVKNKTLVENKEYDDLRTFESTYGVNVKGTIPDGGLFRLEKRQVVYAEFMIDDYNIVCDKKKCESNGKIVILTYNLDGGTLDRTKDKVLKGGTISLPVPTKEHYGFDGWYTDSNERVNNATKFNVNTNLTAHWTKNNYTVTFNAGENGTSTENSLSVEAEGTLTLPSASKEGYTFNGWFTEANGGTEVTNETPILSSQTLYAHYTINTYTVTYNVNGGSEVSPLTISVQHGQTLTLPSTTKTDFNFIGWFDEGYNEITNDTPIRGSMNLSAEWVKTVTEFNYTGAEQEYRVYAGRRYKLEVWGAQGGAGDNGGSGTGYGGYSYGEIRAPKTETYYVYVGGKGANNSNTSCYKATGGWNGGAQSGQENGEAVGAGGGASDIRCGNNSLYSRVIVAGGGGGDDQDNGVAGYTAGGGGLNWTTSTCSGYTPSTSYQPGVSYTSYTSESSIVHPTFGFGGYETGCNGEATGGGGGGWYGGAAAGCQQDGQGGSGWLYTEAAYNTWKNTTPSDANNYQLDSSYYLTNNGGSNGNRSGNGYARITYLGN